ncbi:MAG: DNA-directed RNA polymerase subunit alpha [Actinobacteria bacterium]|nr:DNA-directed RNA polymerase subunit alpha [Actinomycetota bacterium]
MFLESLDRSPASATSQPSVRVAMVSDNFGHFEIEPLRRGLGQTLGNPLRRVLLSGLPGAAVATARIDGVLHEFSTLDFMREDVVDFLLNVKRIRVRSVEAGAATCHLEKQGPGAVMAGDIEAPSGVEIVNPDHYLATLTAKGTLRVEFTVERGLGYVGSEQRSGNPIGVIPLDLVFSPVTKVEYHVEHTRVGQDAEYDRLVVKIWTDGAIGPQDALSAAARQLVESFGLIAGIDTGASVASLEARGGAQEVAGDPLEDLKLSNRAMNCLKRHGVETIQELAKMTEEDLFGLRGMGVRLVEEIREALSTRGLALATGTRSQEPV